MNTVANTMKNQVDMVLGGDGERKCAINEHNDFDAILLFRWGATEIWHEPLGGVELTQKQNIQRGMALIEGWWYYVYSIAGMAYCDSVGYRAPSGCAAFKAHILAVQESAIKELEKQISLAYGVRSRMIEDYARTCADIERASKTP